MNFKKRFSEIFSYHNTKTYSYTLSETQVSNNINPDLEINTNKHISTSLKETKNFITVKYNVLINSDIVLRPLNINIKGNNYSALIFYIDGMTDSDNINNYVLKPLMMKNQNNMFKEINNNNNDNNNNNNSNNNINNVNKSNLQTISNYVFNSLIPQNSVKMSSVFEEVFLAVNTGFTALFIDTLDACFLIEAKGFDSRSVEKPSNEVVIRGSQEGFVENIRTNTSMLRRLINNENLIIEQLSVGKISKTDISLCYMKNITNDDLVNEVRYRINNLKIDSLLNSDTLDRLLQDNTSALFPELLATERPDRASTSLLEGRVVILVNGSPYALIAPAIFIDFLSSPEDLNEKHQFSNLIKFIRLIAFVISILLPGLYVAIINYHQELIPTDLVFAIAAGRKSIPFPVIFEILIMEISFELIREASLRIPSPIGSTVRYNWWSHFRRGCSICKYSKSNSNNSSCNHWNMFFCNSRLFVSILS